MTLVLSIISGLRFAPLGNFLPIPHLASKYDARFMRKASRAPRSGKACIPDSGPAAMADNFYLIHDVTYVVFMSGVRIVTHGLLLSVSASSAIFPALRPGENSHISS